jgi:hypothetical protein
VKSANPTRYTQESSIGHQESRIAQTAYPAKNASRITNHDPRLPAACPPKAGPFGGTHRPRATNYKPPKPQQFCPESENVRRITYEFISILCKTNPILSASGGFKTLYFTKTYDKTTPFGRPKNEPKRTQTNPIFGPSGPPKPKTNPNEPNFKTRNATPKPPKPPNFTCQPKQPRGSNSFSGLYAALVGV